ncbi:MAG: hypothetical protein ACRDK7_04020 [Solirubrobacteraceae bacterium]
MVAGIAGFIEAHSNHPIAATPGLAQDNVVRASQLESAGINISPQPASGLSPTAYDLLHIGSSALVIFGVLLIVVGLIGYWTQRRNAQSS